MKKINIYLISAFDQNINKKQYTFDVNQILIKDDSTCASAIKKVSEKANLIILIPGKLKSYIRVNKIIKKIKVPIIYCSIDNNDLHDKKNSIIRNVNYIIHGFKDKSGQILLESAVKIIKYHGEKKF